MSFLGAGFLTGLFAIGVPLAIHLFAKRKRVHMPWGAMRFLADAKPNWKKRTLRLQDWLVMLMRIIAVALLVLAFARPLIKRPAPPVSGAEFLLIVDRSASTGLAGNAIARQIEQGTESVLNAIPEDARLRFLVNGISHELRELPPLGTDAVNDSRNRSHWLAALQALPPGVENLDWPSAVEQALSYPTITPGRDDRHVIIIADAAIHGYPHSQVAHAETLVDAWQTEGHSITLVPIGVDHPAREMVNLCVDSIIADRQRVTPGEEAVVRATVTNRGTTTSAATRAFWSGQNQSTTLTETKIPPLGPGTRHELVLRRAYPNAGPQALQLSIAATEDSDALTVDNQAAVVVDIVDRVRVISVTDEAPDMIEDDDQRFAQWAFATAVSGTQSIFKLDSVKINAFPTLPLDDVAAIVWSAGNRDPNAVAASANKLHEFVSAGGGLWLQPPAGLNPEPFNAVFFPHDFGLSPAAIDSVTTVSGSGEARIGLRPVIGDSKLDQLGLSPLTELQSHRHFQLRTPMPPSSEVLAEFEGGDAFLVARRLGRGRVVLATLDGYPQWSNLAACSGYVPFVRELLWYLAADHLPNPNLERTDSAPWRQLSNEDSVRLPGGDWIATTELDDSFSQLAAPGLYLLESASDGSHKPYSVARFAAESDIRAVPRDHLQALARVDGVSVFDPEQIAAQLISSPTETSTGPAVTRDREITLWLLVGLIGFLILELVTAQHLLVRRRHAAGGALVK